jgi:hypothetical protein
LDKSVKQPFGRPNKPETRAELLDLFQNPNQDFAAISFFFWNGESLTKERLSWQLEQLSAKGIGGTIVSYIHQPDMDVDAGDPAVFSAAWWELFVWFIQESKHLGMKVGIQDYCVVNPILEQLSLDYPELRGASLQEVHTQSLGSSTLRLEIPDEAVLVSIRAFPTLGASLDFEASLDLQPLMHGAKLEWTAPEGTWSVVAVYAMPKGFSPLHPTSGTRAIERLYTPFETHCGNETGQTLAVFFQDELDFGNRMPRWSPEVALEFKQRKGYELEPELGALWFDLGTRTSKIRIDYADVITQLTEDNYFKPVYNWHEQHGTLFGHDNLGRGDISEGLNVYGDAFRTMRWYSAPGCDDPYLEGKRRFMGFKVNSSIAHLYERPRVWNEGFYGSGWGVTPAQLLAALNEDFAYGATLFNPHALYYTTLGGWWEWAPPDFHFRQPYWKMTAPFWAYVTRISALLSSGHHRCDVAVLYPSTDLEAGFSDAVTCAEDLGRELFDVGLDFDFLDFESLARAKIDNASLQVANEQYRVLIFPNVQAVRFSSLEQALVFKRAGGIVLALGCIPTCTDHLGSNDPEMMAILEELFADFVPNIATVLSTVNANLERDFLPDQRNICVLHRVIERQDLYFVFNRSCEPREVAPLFRQLGRAEIWDALTGTTQIARSCSQVGAYQTVPLRLEPYAAQVIVFDRTRAAVQIMAAQEIVVERLILNKDWAFELVPLLDNRHGDFRQPPSFEPLKPELRHFKCLETTADQDWSAATVDDSDWQEVFADYGTHFWQLETIPENANLESLEQILLNLEQINPQENLQWNGISFKWKEYAYSERFGIEHDRLLSHWLTGPHGLKGQVPDEYLDVTQGEPSATQTSYVYLWTTFENIQPKYLNTKSRAAYRLWLDGELVLEQPLSLGAAHHAPWDIPDYNAPTLQTRVVNAKHRVLLRLKLEPVQRTRASLSIQATQNQVTRGLELLANGFNHRPNQNGHITWLRCLTPPGTNGLQIHVRGTLEAWLDGQTLETVRTNLNPDGSRCVELKTNTPPAQASILALRIQTDAGNYGGAVLARPITFDCHAKTIPLGDWADFGLNNYSGGAKYHQNINLEPLKAGQRLELRLGAVIAAAEIIVNGISVGVLLAAPWNIDIGNHVHAGQNSLEILVANTVANEFSDTPSPYVNPAQTKSGLFGPIELVWLE